MRSVEVHDCAVVYPDSSIRPASAGGATPPIPSHLTPALLWRLRRWANRLRGRYGVPIYLCGSALREDNPDPRDWDVRIMLPDVLFALHFGPVDQWRDEGCTGQWTRTRFRWSDQCVKDDKDFAAWVQLNGDVQIYPESHAATMYAGLPRLRLDTFPDNFTAEEVSLDSHVASLTESCHAECESRALAEARLEEVTAERDRLQQQVQQQGWTEKSALRA